MLKTSGPRAEAGAGAREAGAVAGAAAPGAAVQEEAAAPAAGVQEVELEVGAGLEAGVGLEVGVAWVAPGQLAAARQEEPAA